MIGGDIDERTFPVLIDELLEHLVTNRGEHQAIVEEAQANFRKQYVEKLDAMLQEARAGNRIRMVVGLTVPTSHTGEFDNAIGILNMTKRAGAEKVDITPVEYKRFVQNQWGWSKSFSSSNSSYTSQITEAH